MIRNSVYLFLLLLTACSSTKVLNAEKAEGVDFTGYKTFDFYKAEAKGDTISQNFSNRVEKLEDAIALKMQKFGYLLSKTNPDLLINIGIVENKEVQTRQADFRTDAPRYVGQRHYSWKSEQVDAANYREGTVAVDIVDAKQNKLVWTGAVQDILPDSESRVDATIKKGVNKLLSGYPSSHK